MPVSCAIQDQSRLTALNAHKGWFTPREEVFIKKFADVIVTETPKAKDGLTYKQAGVDIAAGNALVKAIGPMARATARPGSEAGLGGFGGLFDLKAAGYNDPLLVAANDGVGTKLKLAFACGKHDSVGIDLVAMCVNDLVVQGAEPLFFLDYFATGKLEAGEAESVISGIAEGCKLAGAALIGGETAEMPGMYDAGEYDLAGFAVGAVNRDALLPRDNIAEGDVILGLASSGVHSNGFSLVRKLVQISGLGYTDPAPFAPGSTLGEVLLTPTRIYVKPLLEALRNTTGIKALAHITGGGITENIPRILPDGLDAHINLSALTPAPVFGWLSEAGGIEEKEMLLTFNCGIGMALITGANEAAHIMQIMKNAGEHAQRIGKVIEGSRPSRVHYSGKLELKS